MLAGSLLIGFTVVMVALWLEYNDLRGWPSEQAMEQEAALKPKVNPMNAIGPHVGAGAKSLM